MIRGITTPPNPLTKYINLKNALETCKHGTLKSKPYAHFFLIDLLSGILLSPMRPQTCPVQMAASTITCVVQTSYKVALGAVILPFMKRHFKVPPESFQVLAGIPAAGFEENP